jgi:hypothetical protein
MMDLREIDGADGNQIKLAQDYVYGLGTNVLNCRLLQPCCFLIVCLEVNQQTRTLIIHVLLCALKSNTTPLCHGSPNLSFTFIYPMTI